MLAVSHVILCLMVKVWDVTALENVGVCTRCFVHITHLDLSQGKHPGSAWSMTGSGRTEGISKSLRDRLFLSPRIGGSGMAFRSQGLEWR